MLGGAIPMRLAYVGAKAVAVLVAVLLGMSGQAMAQKAEKTTGALPQETSTPPIEKGGVDQAEPAGPTGSGIILVSRRPFEVLAGPSSSASVMYGFPAGRRFRLIGREAGFAQIQDLKSGATGWIDEASLEQSPRVPAVSVPSGPKPAPATHKATTASIERKPKTHVPAAPMLSEHKPAPRSHKTPSAEPKPKTTKRDAKTTTPQTPKRRGIFGLRRNSAQGVLY
jgi:hypothetical protein